MQLSDLDGCLVVCRGRNQEFGSKASKLTLLSSCQIWYWDGVESYRTIQNREPDIKAKNIWFNSLNEKRGELYKPYVNVGRIYSYEEADGQISHALNAEAFYFLDSYVDEWKRYNKRLSNSNRVKWLSGVIELLEKNETEWFPYRTKLTAPEFLAYCQKQLSITQQSLDREESSAQKSVNSGRCKSLRKTSRISGGKKLSEAVGF